MGARDALTVATSAGADHADVMRIPFAVFVVAVMLQLTPHLACYKNPPPCQGQPYPDPCDGRFDRAPKDAGHDG